MLDETLDALWNVMSNMFTFHTQVEKLIGLICLVHRKEYFAYTAMARIMV